MSATATAHPDLPIVLAHNYMAPDIFHGVADLAGDSLQSARMAEAPPPGQRRPGQVSP